MVIATKVGHLRKLYATNSKWQQFFDSAAAATNHSGVTYINQLATEAGNITHRDALIFARRLAVSGWCARFVTGRRGHPTRLVWKYTLPSIGRAARGESDQLEGFDHEIVADSGGPGTSEHSVAEAGRGAKLTIEEAKRGIAATFGLTPEQIEITIRG